MRIKVLYEDDSLLAVEKPAGVLVHGIYQGGKAKHAEETLADWIREKYPKIGSVGDAPQTRPGVVHRLDRETSGVMLLAKNQKAFDFLKNLFKNRQIEKTYLALVWGEIKRDEGVIDKPISIVDGSVKRTVFKGKMQREAITEYKVLKRYTCELGELTLVEAKPKTGRTHQIRVHFASIGHPLAGDKLYGKKYSLPQLDRHFLHAKKIEFLSEDGKRISVVSEIPSEMKKVLAGLKELKQDAPA